MKNVPSNLSNLKSKADKLDFAKLVPVSVYLSKVSDVVNNGVAKKDEYNAKIKITEDKIPDISNVATNNTLHTKIDEVKNEIPNITNLVVTMLLMLLKIKYLMLVIESTKTYCNTKISEIEYKITTDYDHDKYITTQKFNKISSENFTARLAQANLANKIDIANFVKKTHFDDKLKKNR